MRLESTGMENPGVPLKHSFSSANGILRLIKSSHY